MIVLLCWEKKNRKLRVSEDIVTLSEIIVVLWLSNNVKLNYRVSSLLVKVRRKSIPKVETNGNLFLFLHLSNIPLFLNFNRKR